jgi:enoyl-CoA hydratase/carnithine racemase
MTFNPDPDFETVEFRVEDDHVATITLNRPAAFNSFNERMLEEFALIWRRCRRDDDILAVVLQANGERGFSTGVDRKDGRGRHVNPWSDDDPGIYLGAKQNRVWKPLVCALHGVVAGGAFYWVNEADVVICADDATFFDPHTTYGKVSALESVGLLRRVPMAEVLRMALFGLDERISAARAYQIGLVSEVVGKAELRPRAHELARRLASKPPAAIQGTVKAIWDSLDLSGAFARGVGMAYTQVPDEDVEIPMAPGPREPFELR